MIIRLTKWGSLLRATVSCSSREPTRSPTHRRALCGTAAHRGELARSTRSMPVDPEANTLTSTNGATRKKRRVRKFAPARRQDSDEAAELELESSVRKADEVPAWVAPSSLTNGAKGGTEAPKGPQDMSIGELD